MSRIPPASVRLTSNSLNYNQVGASWYYFNAHLKETILHENIVNLLGSNVGFVTMKQKRKHLPRLVMGVLPIFTALRAKKCYDRFLTKSYDWLRTKLFRGAQSSALRYHNAFLFPHTRHAEIADISALPIMWLERDTKDAQLPSITSPFLQNLARYRWKPNKKSYINHSDWYRRFDTQSTRAVAFCGIPTRAVYTRRVVYTAQLSPVKYEQGPRGLCGKSNGRVVFHTRVQKRRAYRPSIMAKNFKTGSPSTYIQNKQEGQKPIRPNTMAIYGAKLKALLSPRKRTKQIMNVCKYDSIMRRPYRKRSNHHYQRRSYGTYRSVCFRRAWSKNSLFALYCLEQIIGKVNAHSTVVFSKAPWRGRRVPTTKAAPKATRMGLCKQPDVCKQLGLVVGSHNHKSALHAQGLHSKPTTSKGNATRLKKRYKRFYDIQYIGMLSSDSRLEIRNGRHIPRSQIDKLRPRTLYELLPGAYKKKFAKLQSLLSTKKWSSKKSGDFKSKFLKNLRLRAKRENNYVHFLDFDRYIGQFKTNVTPKFWVSRRFNVNMIFNLFCFVQGKITGKHKRLSTFQGGCSATAGFSSGVPRLKSGFLFEFDVHSKSSKEIKSLRPTITLRF